MTLALALAAAPAGARVYVSQDEALALAFGDARVTSQPVYLTEAEVKRASELAGSDLPSALVSRFTAERDGATVGTAYVDTHVVRTLPETLLIVVDPAGAVARLEVLSFREPPEYMARAAWYGQFVGRGLDDELRLKRGIHALTGASLTARATTEAVRRVLAIHAVIGERAAEERPPAGANGKSEGGP